MNLTWRAAALLEMFFFWHAAANKCNTPSFQYSIHIQHSTMRGRGYISCKEPLAFLGIRGKKNSHDVRSSSAVAQWQNMMIGPPLGVHTNQYSCTSSRLQRPGLGQSVIVASRRCALHKLLLCVALAVMMAGCVLVCSTFKGRRMHCKHERAANASLGSHSS